MYKLFIFLVWFLSLWAILYADNYRNIIENDNEVHSSIMKISQFNDFYGIYVKKPFWNTQLIGYKHEQLEKLSTSYKYSIVMKLSTENLWFWINLFDIKWEIFLNESWFIDNFRVLVQNDYIVKWERDDKNILVRFWSISDVDLGKWVSKTFNLKDFNFDFLFIKFLPFTDFELNKIYSLNYLMPSQLVNHWINQSSITMKKLDLNTYQISQKIWNFPMDTTLTFNDNKELIKEENTLMSFNLIKDKNQKNTIINKVDWVNNLTWSTQNLTWTNNSNLSHWTWTITGSDDKIDVSKMIDWISSQNKTMTCDLLNK